MPNILLKAQNITKSFQEADSQITILNGVNVEVYQGEMLAILGASGSGKSTLLHILGTLDSPNSGEVMFKDTNLYR